MPKWLSTPFSFHVFPHQSVTPPTSSSTPLRPSGFAHLNSVLPLFPSSPLPPVLSPFSHSSLLLSFFFPLFPPTPSSSLVNCPFPHSSSSPPSFQESSVLFPPLFFPSFLFTYLPLLATPPPPLFPPVTCSLPLPLPSSPLYLHIPLSLLSFTSQTIAFRILVLKGHYSLTPPIIIPPARQHDPKGGPFSFP